MQTHNVSASSANVVEDTSVTDLVAAFTRLAVAVEALVANQRGPVNVQPALEDLPSSPDQVANVSKVPDIASITASITAVSAAASATNTPTVSTTVPANTTQPTVANGQPIPTPQEVEERARALTSADGRWYIVVCGKDVGVFADWDDVSPLVIGCPQAVFKRFDDREAALDQYRTAYIRGKVAIRT